MRNARLLLLAAFAAHAGWMFTIGTFAAGALDSASHSALAYLPFLALAMQVLLAVRLPELARGARLAPIRALTLLSCAGVTALWLGLATHPAFSSWPLGLASALLGVLVWRLVPSPVGPGEPFFLTDRSHAASGDARRCLAAMTGHALAVTPLVSWPFEGALEPLPHRLVLLGAAYALGILVSAWQKYPQRAVGLVPLAALLALLAAVGAAIWPSASWPAWPLGFAAGLAHMPPRNWLLVSVPARQRMPALLLGALGQLLGAAAGIALVVYLPAPVFARIMVLVMLAPIAIRGLMRELVEQVIEFGLMPFYPIRGYGPGLLAAPMRGPVLIVANHCAWLDPLWLAKVIPLQLRPMMTSKFFDKPGIRWLVTRVFHAIRVPDVGFRREAPEIQDAIAGIDAGVSVLIFPEGWLKRKDTQSLKRFGQGAYQILREQPRTPVIACWIEGGWGSFTSYFNGPPTKNKKMDVRRPIRIGVSEPEVLSLEMLHDHLKTRQHLMRLVLKARTYIGLPELPPPTFAAEDDKDESPPA